MEEPAEVKVTRLKKIVYGIRIWLFGKLWSERVVKARDEVSRSIASDLRMIDKCGNPSPMAGASRDRQKRRRTGGGV